MYFFCLCQKIYEFVCRQRYKKEVNIDSDDEYFDFNGYLVKFGFFYIFGDWWGIYEELFRYIRRQRRVVKVKKREEELKSDLGVYCNICIVINLKRLLNDFIRGFKIFFD